MGWRVIRHIRKRIRELPNDRRNHEVARNTLTNARSLHEVVQIAGYKLSEDEGKFFKAIPPTIDSAIRGAIVASIAPGTRSRVNFDVAYLAEGSGYTLTVSAPKRTGDVEVVLQAPAPYGAAPATPSSSSAPRTTRAVRTKAAGARRKTSAKRKPAARKRGR